MLRLEVWSEAIPLAQPFKIAHGTRTTAHLLRLRLTAETSHISVTAESVPYARYGEDCETVIKQIQDLRHLIEDGTIHGDNCAHYLGAGSARNALDMGFYLLNTHKNSSGQKMHGAVQTAYTIGLEPAAQCWEIARRENKRPLFKVKLAGHDDLERLQAVRSAAPMCTIIADANESLTVAQYHEYLPILVDLNVAMLEQPFKAGAEDLLAGIPRPIPIYADESVHTIDDFHRVGGYFDGVNIKLDKSGGFSHAQRLKQAVLSTNKQFMVGCMVGSSLSMMGAFLLSESAKFVDIDGPIWLKYDSVPNFIYYTDGRVEPSKMMRQYLQC